MDITTEYLSDYSSGLAYERLSPEAIHQVKRTLIDTLGCGVGAFDAEPPSIARRIASRTQGNPPARIIGTLQKSSMDLAAFANTSLIRYLDCNDAYAARGTGHPSDMHAANHERPPDRTSRLAHCSARSTGFRCAIVAMHATPSFTFEVRAAIAPNRGMHSNRGLLNILSPTQIASTAPLASAVTAISIRSVGGVPRVTNARLDNVRPKVIFFAMLTKIGRGRA